MLALCISFVKSRLSVSLSLSFSLNLTLALHLSLFQLRSICLDYCATRMFWTAYFKLNGIECECVCCELHFVIHHSNLWTPLFHFAIFNAKKNKFEQHPMTKSSEWLWFARTSAAAAAASSNRKCAPNLHFNVFTFYYYYYYNLMPLNLGCNANGESCSFLFGAIAFCIAKLCTFGFIDWTINEPMYTNIKNKHSSKFPGLNRLHQKNMHKIYDNQT